MNVDTATALVASRMGNRTNYDTDGTILTELISSQKELEQGDPDTGTLPWFLLTDIYNSANDLANSAVNLDVIDLPSGFLEEYEYGTLWLYDSSGDNPWQKLSRVLTIEEMFDARDSYSTDLSGTPTNYLVYEDKIILGPRFPSTVKVFRWAYYKADTLPALAGAENLWLANAAEVLLNHTGIKMARYYAMNEKLAKMFETEYGKALKTMWNKNERRMAQNVDQQMKFTNRR